MVLEYDEFVFFEVGDVCGVGLDVLFEEDLVGVCLLEVFFFGVGVEVWVGVVVVGVMFVSLLEGWVLDVVGVVDEEENLEGGGGFEGVVGVEFVGVGGWVCERKSWMLSLDIWGGWFLGFIYWWCWISIGRLIIIMFWFVRV